MTTYLTTGIEYRGSEVVLPYCSPSCRLGCTVIEVERRSVSRNPRHLDLESYEFDEVCALCGVVIPASSQRDLDALRIAALAESEPRSSAWSRIRRAAATEFTRTA